MPRNLAMEIGMIQQIRKALALLPKDDQDRIIRTVFDSILEQPHLSEFERRRLEQLREEIERSVERAA